MIAFLLLGLLPGFSGCLSGDEVALRSIEPSDFSAEIVTPNTCDPFLEPLDMKTVLGGQRMRSLRPERVQSELPLTPPLSER